MCKTKFENIIHPLAVVGLVAIKVVHGHVLDACDNLETCFIEFLVKNTHKTCEKLSFKTLILNL